jgi:hypothetical protein
MRPFGRSLLHRTLILSPRCALLLLLGRDGTPGTAKRTRNDLRVTFAWQLFVGTRMLMRSPTANRRVERLRPGRGVGTWVSKPPPPPRARGTAREHVSVASTRLVRVGGGGDRATGTSAPRRSCSAHSFVAASARRAGPTLPPPPFLHLRRCRRRPPSHFRPPPRNGPDLLRRRRASTAAGSR